MKTKPDLMRRFMAICILLALTGCGGAKVAPVSIMQRWIGEPFEKVMKDSSWKAKHFKEDAWTNGGTIHYFRDKGSIPALKSDASSDKDTGVSYTGPAGTDGNRFYVINKFYVDASGTIREWEIVQTSAQPVSSN